MKATSLILLVLINKTLFANNNYTDTIFLKKNIKQTIYIDTAKNSMGYTALSRFELKEEFFKQFKSEYKKYNLRDSTLTKFNLGNFPSRWVQIVMYENKFYAYSPCDYLNDFRYTINDSCFVDYTDLPSPSKIISYKKSKKYYYFKIQSLDNIIKEIKFSFIDKFKGIAIVEEKENKKEKKYHLMMDLKRIKEIPVIVNNCIEWSDEFEFNEKEYLNIFINKYL